MRPYRTDKFPALAVFCAKLNEHVVMYLSRYVSSRPHLAKGSLIVPAEGQTTAVGTDPEILGV